MGKIMTKVKVTNNTDRDKATAGELDPAKVRTIEIEALVDTGATLLALPADVCRTLGLAHKGLRRVRYADGRVQDVPWVGGVLIEILGREMTCDALVQAEGTTPLIGQIPLEGLDLIVDPKTLDVLVNPASPDIPLMELLRVA